LVAVAAAAAAAAKLNDACALSQFIYSIAGCLTENPFAAWLEMV
jgi:hypothetical protein